MKFDRFFPLAAAMCGVMALSGCGGNEPDSPQQTPISGIVTLNDQPLADALVYFHRQGEPSEGLVPAAKTDANGRYEMICDQRLGAARGKYKVTVQGQNIPAKYGERGSSDVEFDLTDPKRVIGYDIKLTSDAAAASS